MLALGLIYCVVGLAVPQLPDQIPLKSIETFEETLAQAIKDPTLWKDSAQKDTLLEHLRLLGRLKTSSAIPTLIEHIDFHSAYGRPTTPLMKTEVLYPVVGALRQVGVAAIPQILETLKTTDPSDSKKSNQQRVSLLLYSLILIYDQGGEGEAMARERIQIEIKKAKTPQAEKLLRGLLGHPHLAGGSK